MLKKINSKNLFSFEEHDDTKAEELPEQGTVTEADVEDVVAPVKPSEDVTEAGDDIAQTTPTEEIDAEPDADLTATETVTETTTDEVSKLTEDGEAAASVKDEIVASATAEVTGGEGKDTDINGNAITPEQAAENDDEEALDEVVDEEATKTAAEKDITEQVDEVNENVDEQLGDAIGDDSTDGGIDGENLDDTSDDIDSDGGQGDLGMDAALGGEGDPEGGDDVEFDDDTPLEGGDDDSASDTTVESSAGDVGTDETSEGSDLDDVESNTDDELATDEVMDDTEGDTEGASVADDVAKQNEAADVTADAASSDAEQTEFIAGETPEQHGEEPESDQLPDNDGEEIVAEAAPAVQNETDVSTANADTDVTQSTADTIDFEEDDDVPLDGTETEGLDVEVDSNLTPTEVDGKDSTGATVEESQSDQQAEELDIESEDESEETESEEEPGIDAEAGEVEETEEEADLEEGELDIPDVDDETTEEEVEEAEIEADTIEAEADAEEAEGDDADKTIEELQKEAESLEEFRIILEHSIATESYSPQMLAYIVAKTEPVRHVLNNLGCKIQAVSLEEYTAKDMDLAYGVALESVRGFISRLTTINGKLVQKVERWWSKGMIDKVKTRTSALNKQIDLCLVKLKDADVTTKEVNAIGAYLSFADDHLLKSVSNDFKMVTDVSVKGFKATEELQGNLVKALNDITAAGSPAEATSIADKVARFKDTKSAFPSRAFTHGFLGGFKFELKDATAGSELKDKILNMGRRAVPVVVKEGKGEKTSQKLSKGDTLNLLKMAKAYVALADKLADTVGDRAVDNVSKLRLTRERALPIGVEGRIRGGDEKAIDAAASALEITAKAHNDLYKFITKHCIDVADALCGVSKKVIG